MVPFIETFQNVLKRIEGAKISYMIVGSIASMVYGEPRLTRDIDLVVDIDSKEAQKFATLFSQPEYYCPPFDDSRFSRKQRLELWHGFHAYLASAEDVILKKLEFFREGGSEKHLRDIRGVVSNTELDQQYLQHWLKQLHLEPEWAKV